MAKVIKEIIIMLLICLVGMLLFAVVFYEFIPSRKSVAEVTKYVATDEVQQMLADDIDEENQQVIKTYEVTSSDLNNYEFKNEYVPGKANPFEYLPENVEGQATTNNSNTIDQSNTNNTNTNNDSFIRDEGTK